MEKRWTFPPAVDKTIAQQLTADLGIDMVLVELLISRGITTFEEAKTFFRPELSQLHDPFLMQDMLKAVERINQAIENKENILVYGDYDVDGTTSVSMVYSFLSSVYPNVDSYIPDRYSEGYGISFQGIDYAEDNGISLIIALDCGIKAIDKIDYANEKGIDFIICDHHRPGDKLPKAVAVLDPKREDCEYPYKELSGCGVGFKLIQALAKEWDILEDSLAQYLDLLATSIGADLVHITGENRVLAHYGLKRINENPRPGFKAFMNNHKKQEFSIMEVVFNLGPRINAAGRMEHGHRAVELLTCEDERLANELAEGIEAHNQDRKEVDRSITLEALQLIEDNKEQDRKTTVVYQPHWHKGVVGIVASRLTETYYRPTIVLTESNGKLSGSARSVKGFDVYNAIDACSDVLEQFGGHMYAAGMTMKKENFELFKQRFEEEVANTIDPELLIPEERVDAEITFADITPKFHRILKQFAPHGPENMSPAFVTRNVKDTGYAKTLGADNTHLKLNVKDASTNNYFGAIGFNLGHFYQPISEGKAFDMVYAIEENEWNGKVSLQLRIKDIKIIN